MPKKHTNTLDGISSEAARKATGHDWADWIAILDQAGAKKWNHKEIVAHLKVAHELSGWWQQMVTVAYEKSKGRRVVGQTANAGFQVGIQKTIPINLDDAWTLLSSPPGVRCWLGKVQRFTLTEGRTYMTDTGIEGEIRVVKPANRVRLSWRKPDMQRPATLQIALAKSGEKTSFRIHLEHLASQEDREEMKKHWRAVLDRLAQLAVE